MAHIRWMNTKWMGSQSQNVKTMAKATGKARKLDFAYILKTERINIQLHFVYLVMDVAHEELWWIQRDEMRPVLSPYNN